MTSDFVFTPANYFRELRKEEVFANAAAPLEVDLGCGEGHFIEGMAAMYPERNFLAVERLQGRVKNTARKLEKKGLHNGKVLRLETAYTVSWLLPAKSVSRVHLLCPDPWPKKKHHARRLVNRKDFITGLLRVLEDGGEFLLKTDDTEYFENALESFREMAVDEVTGAPLLEQLPWEDAEFPYVQTGFEKYWISLGRSIHRVRWRKLFN